MAINFLTRIFGRQRVATKDVKTPTFEENQACEEDDAHDGADLPEEISDAMYAQAVASVRKSGKASIAHVSRSLNIRFRSAASLVERMEREGVLSSASPVGKRTVYF